MRSRTTLLTALAVVALGAGCGDDDDTANAPVGSDAAAAAIAAAEADLTEARSAFADAGAQFCTDAGDYVSALDRYGQVFDDTAATVGDVETLGADLARPREAAASSAASVVEARESLTEAEQALADAQAAGTGTPAPSVPATTVVPPATIDRVAQAEDELAAAAEGITAETPLVDAAAQYNAAAFALEIASLRLVADAGCLSDEQEADAIAAVSSYTGALQTALATAGYYDGAIDGVYGPGTAGGVEALQTDNGLPVTGFVDEATALALETTLIAIEGIDAQAATAHTAAVQTLLTLSGHWTDPIDGVWTPELSAALEAFQTELGAPPTGAVDPATLHALLEAIVAGRAEAATTTTAVTDETATTVDSTTTTAAP